MAEHSSSSLSSSSSPSSATKSEKKSSRSQLKRHLSFWSQLGVGSIIWLAVLIASSAALHKADWRTDLTPHGQFSLQPGLSEIINQIDTTTEIIALWPRPSDAGPWQPQLESLQQQLRRIAQAHPRLQFRWIDSLNDKPALDAFQTEHAFTSAPNIYLKQGDKPLYRIAVHGGLLPRLQQEIGGALVSLSQDQLLPVYVITINSDLVTDGSEQGAELAWQYLRRSGAELIRLDQTDISTSQRIPTDGVAIVAAPKGPWPEVAKQALIDYLESQGNLLLIADDRLPLDLHLLLRRRGIMVALPPPPNQTERTEQTAETTSTNGHTFHPPEVIHHLDASLRAGTLRFDRLLLSPEFGIYGSPAKPAADRQRSRSTHASQHPGMDHRRT